MIWSPGEYVPSAVIANQVGHEMLSRLAWVTLQPMTAIDVGCGTGYLSMQLQQHYPHAHILALDASELMLCHDAVPLAICADGGQLPLQDQSVDLIFSNLMLPWYPSVENLLQEWRRVLRPEGLLMFSALGMDTLQEWRTVLHHCEIPQLFDLHDLGDLLLQVGFTDPVIDIDHYTLTYRDCNKMYAELRATGMLLSSQGDAAILQQMATVPKMVDEEKWAVTYEVIYANAFVSAEQAEHAIDADGVVRVPLTKLRR